MYSHLNAQTNDEALLGKDITLSIGAGKNKFFENYQFELAAPLEVPINLNIGINKQIEIGLEWSPLLFNDKSPYSFEGYDSTRNQFAGNLQNSNLNFQYSLNNYYRMNGYFQVNGGYSYLHKKQWIAGDLNEVIGEGYNWSFGGGIRYQLGNEYDDVFPWFFDISLVYTRYNINTTAYKINTISQPKGEGYWNDLKFGSLDVIMRFGYRLRFKK
ncbi:MAG: hypothetical protein CMP61_01985 [Flavobacteriales bacterium]|nr:hypothetical protein [Flavobacteriales bacterium]|tara:strand:+ start:12460 stop:13101 length:642 start_codon:yes stop_codon:yes gene_type:complete